MEPASRREVMKVYHRRPCRDQMELDIVPAGQSLRLSASALAGKNMIAISTFSNRWLVEICESFRCVVRYVPNVPSLFLVGKTTRSFARWLGWATLLSLLSVALY